MTAPGRWGRNELRRGGGGEGKERKQLSVRAGVGAASMSHVAEDGLGSNSAKAYLRVLNGLAWLALGRAREDRYVLEKQS